ncbi:Ribokinase-like protein [Scheffersomyces xylosifermentans]|uniref:Ribokinase-like protein n=1 Tax=Scheffersomyces xylosifermentans TaxID=1304137 RepID=UPI00315D5E5F
MASKNLLTISSHVSHGYVGNRATVFPLQYYGWDVDAINTTNFSNHPGFGTFAGKASPPELVNDIFQGLKDIVDFDEHYDLILTGYSPNDEVLQIIYNQLITVFNSSSSAKKPQWIVDPVLGDNGRLYVSEKVIPVYKAILSSGFVTLITPNQFELEILSDTKITDWDSIKTALLKIQELYNIPNVVLSSVLIDGEMYGVGYSAEAEEGKRVFYFPITQIHCHFNGCGDLFTALMANAFYENKNKLTPAVLGDVLVKLNLILEHSYKAEVEENGSTEVKSVKSLRIISSREVLLEDNREDIIGRVSYLVGV